MINHRSLFKVVFNPIFRYFGFCVGTPYDIADYKLIGIVKFFKVESENKITYSKYILDNDMKIVKKRMII